MHVALSFKRIPLGTEVKYFKEFPIIKIFELGKAKTFFLQKRTYENDSSCLLMALDYLEIKF